MATGVDIESAMKVKAVLSSRDDWRGWYQVIKDHANERDVWEYFDPDTDNDTRPKPPNKPRIPAGNEASENAYRYYQMMLQDWKDTRNAIRSTNEAIRGSVALHVRELIADRETHEMLQILKQQYAPSDQEADLGALKSYNAVRARPIRQGRVSTWLNDFDNAYLAIRRRNLPESNDTHVKRQFLAAISSVSYSFADRQAEMMNDPTYEQEDFHALLGRYRTYLANSEGFKTTTSSMAFATFNGQGDHQSNSSNNTQKHQCVCGKNHAYSNCCVEINGSLKNCFILDSGASTHVCNDISRFETLTNVAYVPGLHTNIVGARRLKQAGYSWDFDNNTVKKGNNVIFRIGDHPSGLWIVEQRGTDQHAFATPETDTEATTGVQVNDLDANHGSKQPCEDCKLANAPQQISRRSMMIL